MSLAPFWRSLALLVALLALLPLSGPLFQTLFPALERPLYTRASLAWLTLAHLGLTLAATAVAALAGVAGGILATRPGGRDIRPTVLALCAAGQTFPPVAVLAIAVPLLGYGAAPTFVALALYAVLPVLSATIAGLDGIDPAVRRAADGMGFPAGQRLRRVELPLAAPVILSGLRTATLINLGTATIGSTVGAATLGSPVIEGLSGSNPAYVIQGSLVLAVLAVTLDRGFEALAARANRAAGRPLTPS